MKKGIVLIIALLNLLNFRSGYSQVTEDVASASDNLVAQPVPDLSVYYNVSDSGEYKPIIWGLDLAWLSEENIRRGMAYMGVDRVDVVRSSFTPTSPLVDGELQAEELSRLNERLDIIDLLGSNTEVVLNCDHPSVDPWFVGNAERWAQLIDITTTHHEERGRKVVTVSPFNEPDLSSTGQGTLTDFYNIAGELRNNPHFDSIRISGGNTLNTDQSLDWYNQLKSRLDEGNTHQLAGSFDNYASFFKTVRANGHHASNDELHNVMEAMVGVEYGMQTGIWWGTAEFARGEFVKASDGHRLGYAEHRDNWTAASVYRSPDGKVQAFGGTSERQAATTTFRFVSKDRDVFYDGYGPQREYTLVMPGGTGYQVGQTNAEKVVNITWGEDIQPVISGRYVLVNRNSGLVMEVADGSANAGANLQQGISVGNTYQQWNVSPVSSRIGGDFSYFTISAVHSAKAVDVYNWSLNNGGNLVVWDDTKGSNQQWYLEYAEDGWFYIRSRHSAKCLEVASASKTNGANIQQWEKDGGRNQQWRFLPIDAPVEFDTPGAPENLVATGNAESIRLDWSASMDSDVTGYTIFRSESSDGSFQTIARNISTTSFVDNTTTTGGQYFYKVKAMDYSLNQSEYSNEASATINEENVLVTHFQFNGNTLDTTINLNHAASYGGVSFVEGKVGSTALALNGSNAFIQLPANLPHQKEISIATWVYWNGGATWQRIFDFGNNENEYMYLTPKLRFAIKNRETEHHLDAAALPEDEWSHVTVTLGTSGVYLYVNGELVGETNTITISPLDFKPILNYIGRGQYTVPFFNGAIDDFMVYNYTLTAEEIVELYTKENNVVEVTEIDLHSAKNLSIWPMPANDVVWVNYSLKNNKDVLTLSLFNVNGKLVRKESINYPYQAKLNISELPGGIYILKLTSSKESITKKLIIKHK